MQWNLRKKLEIVSKKNLTVNQYTMNYLKSKIKSYNEKINSNFEDNEIPRKGSPFISLSVILINCLFRTDEYIIDDIETSPDCDRENSNEERPDEENSSK